MTENLHRPLLGLASLLLVGAVSLLAACSDPDAEILDGLAEAERARFLSGRQVANPCWTCHDLKTNTPKVGPGLRGVFGRQAGHAPGFKASAALRESGVVWNDRTLSAFLMDVQGFIPGAAMVAPSLRDPAALSDLLVYLRYVTSAPASD